MSISFKAIAVSSALALCMPLSFSRAKSITKARAVVENPKCGILLGLSGGMWGLPGGAIEGDEESRSAALREIREETSLTGSAILDVRLLGTNDKLRADIFWVRVDADFCHLVTPVNDLDHEFSELKWFPPNNLPANTYSDAVEHIVWFLSFSR